MLSIKFTNRTTRNIKECSAVQEWNARDDLIYPRRKYLRGKFARTSDLLFRKIIPLCLPRVVGIFLGCIVIANVFLVVFSRPVI